MADEMRTCRKTACRWPAAASLSFRYATKEVWLVDLSAEAEPSLYDLCPHHADALTVPKGWTQVDQRTSQAVPQEAAAADRVAEPTPAAQVSVSATGSGNGSGSRYEALAADLPRLAAEWANGNGAWLGEEPLTMAPPVVPSEDVPGQLAILVEEREQNDDAVVVSIERARSST